MLKIFEFLFYKLPLILSCLYLVTAAILIVLHIKTFLKKAPQTISMWIFAIFNCGYVLSFLFTLVFFFEIWQNLFAFLGILAIIVCFCYTRYDDVKNGRRWWNW